MIEILKRMSIIWIGDIACNSRNHQHLVADPARACGKNFWTGPETDESARVLWRTSCCHFLENRRTQILLGGACRLSLDLRVQKASSDTYRLIQFKITRFWSSAIDMGKTRRRPSPNKNITMSAHVYPPFSLHLLTIAVLLRLQMWRHIRIFRNANRNILADTANNRVLIRNEKIPSLPRSRFSWCKHTCHLNITAGRLTFCIRKSFCSEITAEGVWKENATTVRKKLWISDYLAGRISGT
jgi:hypothetical protein